MDSILQGGIHTYVFLNKLSIFMDGFLIAQEYNSSAPWNHTCNLYRLSFLATISHNIN